MEQRVIFISRNNAYCLLQECTRREDLKCGRRVQSLMAQSGLDTIPALADHLIRLFASFKCLLEAIQVFRKVPQPSVYTYCAIISAYANLGHSQDAIELYQKMELSGVKGNNYVHLSVLKAYFNTGNFEAARKIFDKLLCQDVVAWNAMITAYAQHGQGLVAFECFMKMQQVGIKPNKVTFLSTLKACCSIRAIDQGQHVHKHIIESGLQSDIVIGSALVDMYSKCGNLDQAREVFDSLPYHDVVLWNTIIAGYTLHGKGQVALECFEIMKREGIKPDKVAFSSALKACASIVDITKGQDIHRQVNKCGLQFDLLVGNALIDMYAKCGSLEIAREIFNKLPHRDIVSWNVMIAGYAHCGDGLRAVECFNSMLQEKMRPDIITFSSVLRACGSMGAIDQGRGIHDTIIEMGMEIDVILWNTLVDMYVKCGSLGEAHKVFEKMPDQVIYTWNILIAGYGQLGNVASALQCLDNMLHKGIEPDEVTFVGVLNAFSNAGLLDEARVFSGYMTKSHGIQTNMFHSNCMVDLLGHASCFKEAEDLARSAPNVSGWMSLLSSCSLHGNVELGRKCFSEIVHLKSNYCLQVRADKLEKLDI